MERTARILDGFKRLDDLAGESLATTSDVYAALNERVLQPVETYGSDYHVEGYPGTPFARWHVESISEGCWRIW